MAYNTGNSVPSTDAKDFIDNCENLDKAVNSLESTFQDRLGVTRSTWDGIAKGLSFFNVGTFAVGFTLTNSRQTLTHDGHEYGWSGVFPKVVNAGSTPTPLGAGGWVDRTDVTLRGDIEASVFDALRRSYAEAGLTLVDGSFEEGGTLTSSSDVLLNKKDGKAYSWTGSYPSGGYFVLPGTDPILSPSFAQCDAQLREQTVILFDTVADMKNDLRLSDGDNVRTRGYYAPDDGGGSNYTIIQSSSADGIGDHQLQSGLVAMIVHAGIVDSRQYGAKANEPGFDCSSSISTAMKNPKVKQVTVYGHQYLLSPLDLTEISSDVSGRKKLIGYAGNTGVYDNGNVIENDYSDCLIFKHTQACGIDLSGSSMLILENLGMMSDISTSPRVGVLLQRTSKYDSCKRHIFRNVRISMRATSNTVNGGFGYIGIYNSRGEDNTFEDCVVVADAPHVLTIDDCLGIQSPYKGGYANSDYANYTVSNNRFENSSAVANLSSPYTLDGVSGMYIDGGYHNAKNKNRLIRCINRHSRNIRVKNPHCELLGAFLRYDATSSIGYDPETFSLIGGQLTGFDISASDRWDGMFLFSGNNLVINNLEFDLNIRDNTKLISFVKFTGTGSTLTGVRVTINTASSSNAVFDGNFIDGDVTAENIDIMCGSRTAESVYVKAHSDLRKFRNYRINGRTSCAFSKLATKSAPLDVTFTNESGTAVVPSEFSLYMASVNGVNRIKGFIRLSSPPASGTLKILLSNTFFPIRTTAIGVATFADAIGYYNAEIDTSISSSATTLLIPMQYFSSSTLKECDVDCLF